MNEEELLERLGSAAAALEDRFSLGGDIDLPGGIVIQAWKDEQTFSLKLPGCLEPAKSKKGNAPLDNLLKVCDPSGFGHGNETRYDPTVRRACHVPAERLKIDGFDLEKSGILEEVRLALSPDAERIHFTLLKMNVYPEGGHFASHRDTPPTPPDGRIHLGSLVVVLPAAHVGGGLTVQHRGDVKTYCFDESLASGTSWRTHDQAGASALKPSSFFFSAGNYEAEQRKQLEVHASKVRAGVSNSLLSWAAFYGDCEHTVAQVELGTRISLSYQLFIDSSASASVQPEDDAEAQENAKLAEAANVSRAIQDYLNQKKLADLKDLCKTVGCPVSGSKAVLLSRLNSIPPDQFMAKMPEPVRPQILSQQPRQAVRFLPTAKSLGKARGFARILRSALKNPEFMPSGGEIGFPCFHLYECEADLPRVPLSPSVKSSEIHLKGADAIIAVVAARMGLALRFLRICHFVDGGDGCWRITEELISHNNVGKILEDVCVEESFMAKGLDLQDDYESSSLFGGISWAIGFSLKDGKSAPGAKNLSISERPPIGKVLDDIFMSGTGYFGNEASSGSIYNNVAIVIDVPPFDSESRKQDLDCPLPEESLRHTRAGSDPRSEEAHFHHLSKRVRLPAPKRMPPQRIHGRFGGHDEECVIC